MSNTMAAAYEDSLCIGRWLHLFGLLAVSSEYNAKGFAILRILLRLCIL